MLQPDEVVVINTIRQHGALSRTDLARLTGYSRAKMTAVATRLLDTGILHEIGPGESSGGRRPRMLNFNVSQGFVVGVDLGATSLDVALADLRGTELGRWSEPADVREGPQQVLSQLSRCVTSLLERHAVPAEKLHAIGFGVPGPVQFATGMLIAPPLMPEWESYPIRSRLREVFPAAQVIVDNDVNLMALGELRNGSGRGVDNFIVIKIGTGIGAGIVCNGNIYRGSDGCAGDIGHICVDQHGPMCRCGNVGCLEAMVSGPALAARANAAAKAGRSEYLAQRLQSMGALAADDVGAAAAAGDIVAIEMIQESGRLIGEVLASLVNFFNPRLILIGGGVSAIGFQLLSSIRQTVLRRSPPLSTKDLRIDYTGLRHNSGITGALALALEHVFLPAAPAMTAM